MTIEGSVARSFIGIYLTFLRSIYIYFISPEGERGCCEALLKESSATLSRACTLSPLGGEENTNPRVNRLSSLLIPLRG